MSADTVYTRTIRRAIDSIGSMEQFAADLGVSVDEVEGWVAGLTTPPAAIFLRAIDIVAQGRLTRTQS